VSDSATEPLHVICLKYGTRYPASYVNRLYAGVERHLSRPFEFHCCTDDPEGVRPEVKIIAFPENPGIKCWWPHVLVKLMLTQAGFGGLSGPTLFLDLDLIITGSLDAFFDYEPGRFCIIHNWASVRKRLTGKRPAVGNSSVFRFDSGPKSGEIYQTFLREMDRAEDRSQFNTEQAFLTYAMKDPVWWPESWVQSFKWNLRPTFPLNLLVAPKKPQDCRIVVFHGKPDPDEAIAGYHGKKIHHHTRPAPWIADHWVE